MREGLDPNQPQLGAQFAQLVKELRSEYGAVVRQVAERITCALFSGSNNLQAILHHCLANNASAVVGQVAF